MELLNIWLLTIPGATLVADLRKKCRNQQEPVQALRVLLLERAHDATPTDKASASSDFEYLMGIGPEMPIKKVAFDEFIREVTRLRERLPEASRGDDTACSTRAWRDTLLALRRHRDPVEIPTQEFTGEAGVLLAAGPGGGRRRARRLRPRVG